MKSSINHFYRVIWSDVLNAWIAVSELTKSKGKSSSSGSRAAQKAVLDKQAGTWISYKIRLKPIVFIVACCYSLNGLANPVIANNVVIDGRTATQISVSGSTTNITTSSVSGTTGFNSFKTFVVNQGNTANLILPQGTASLVNIVRNSQTVINGVVNGYKNGSIGGNVFFADPYGVVVGASGAINVGSLTVSTPTAAFLDQVIDAKGVIDAASASRLQANNYPISPDGLISIRGTINAPDGISLLGENVHVSGTMTTGDAAAAQQIALFKSSVNTTGVAQANALVEHNGTIEIVAQNAVEISGELHADGASSQNAGNIAVSTVGGSINVDNTAVLSAKGQGSHSGGGKITVYAGTDINVGIAGTLASDVAGATAKNGPQFNASAGSSGNGGTIETSAHGTANLHGGIFDASASDGIAGNWIVDPTDIVIDGGASSIFTNGSNEILAASHSIVINTGGEINTRKVGQPAITAGTADTAVSIGNSGSVSLNAPNISVDGKIDAHADSSFSAGDITLTASDTNGSFLIAGGFATASTGIDISGTVTGANISFLASSSAISSYTDGTVAMASSTAGDAAGSVLGAGVGVVSGDASAYVKIHKRAVVTATGDVALDAASIATADDSIINLGFLSLNPTSKIAIPAVVYGNVKAISTAQIESGASVTAGGELTVRAHNTANLNVSTTTATTTTPIDLSVAYGTADVESTAQIDSGATVKAHSARVVALNQNQFSITASNYALGNGAAGLAFALADGLKSSATALEGASLTLPGSLQVEADSLTTKDVVTSSTTVGASALVRPITSAASSLGSFVQNKLVGGPSATEGATSMVKIGSALALTLNNNQTATAKIAASPTLSSAPVIKAGGTVAIVAQALDTGVKSSGSSGINSPSVSDATAANPSATYSLSAGVAVAERTLTADAEVGNGVAITASDIGVHSSDSLLPSITWLSDLTALGSSTTWTSSPTTAIKDIQSHLNGNLGLCNDVATTCTNATGDATKVGLAGSVNYFAVTSNTTAWVGQGATLTTTGAGTAVPWSVNLDTGDDASLGALLPSGSTATAPTQAFNAQVFVQAENTVQTINVGGSYSATTLIPGIGATPSTSSGNVGGAVNFIKYKDNTLAGIGAGAVVNTAGALAVNASSYDYALSIIPSAGKGGAIAGAGMMGYTTINDTTHASISNLAQIKAAAIDLNASEALNVMTIAGAFESSNSAAVGIGVSVNNLTTDTQAFIGNNSGDDPLGVYTGTAPGNAGFTTASLDIASQTVGSIYAIGAAGSLASSSARPAVEGPVTASGEAPAYPSDAPPQPTYGLAVSGSGAANTISLGTSSYIDGTSAATPVTITYDPVLAMGPAGSPTDFLTVNALRDTYVFTLAGAAAITSANSSSSQTSSAIGGTVAYESSTNQTNASINNAKLMGFKNVTVQALTAGQNINVGVDFAANTTNSGDANYSAAGSVSLAQINDGVSASINDSIITGDSSTDSAVNVTAYDRTNIGIGGGSFYYGGQGGGSVALSSLTIADPSNGNATNASITGSNISDYATLSVSAVNSDRVIIGAATGGGGSSTNGFSGAIVYDDIKRTTRAMIGSDVSGTASTIHTAGDISVTAGGGDQANLDAIIANAGAPADSSGIDFTGTGKTTPNFGPGAAIIAVAGVVQAGKNNVGMSFAENTVTDTMLAQISNATVTSDAGAVNVTANNATTILGLSAGVGVATGKFAGLGSSTDNNINDITTAQIGDAATSTSPTTQMIAQSLTVSATDSSSIQALAGNVAANTNGSAGGAAVAANNIGDTTRADVSNYALNINSATAITATSSGTIQSVAASGAVAAGSLAFSGSATTNQINNNLDAYMTGSSLNDPSVFTTPTPSLTNTLNITASDKSTIESLAGAVAVSSKVGVGVALAVNRIGGGASGENVAAYIDGGKIAATNVGVSAQSTAAINTLSAGVAVSGQVAAAGSLSTNVIDANVTADITNGAQVTALNNVAVLAGNTGTISVIAGAAGIGVNTTGVGLSVVVNDMGGTTQAYVSGAATKVDALGQSAGVSVNSGTLANPFDVSSVQAPSTSTPDLTETQAAVSGLAIVATSDQAVNTDAVSLGVSKGVGAGIVAVVNLMGGTTQAYIDSASIDTQLPNASALPSVDVTSISHSYAANFVLGAAAGGLGASGAMSVNTMNRSTDAYISSATLGGLDATTGAPTVGAVTVKSIASQDSATIVGGFAAGGTAGAATGIVNQFGADTEAYVNNGTLTAASLSVKADSANGYNALAGGAAAGASASLAATFAVADSHDTTRAYVGNTSTATTLALTGALNVAATTENTYNSIVASGALAGGAGIAGMVDVTMLNNTTSAGLYDLTAGTSTKPAGDVTVSAAEDVKITPYAGALAGGGAAGVGAGANVVMVQSNVTGEIVNSHIKSAGTVLVSASSTKDIEAVTATAGVGGSAGMGAAVALLLVGSGDSSNAMSALSGSLSSVGSFSSSAAQSNSDTSLSATEQSNINTQTNFNLTGAINNSNSDGVSASIDAKSTISAAQVGVFAGSTILTSNVAGAAGIGGVLGLGGGVGYTRIYDHISAASLGAITAPVVAVTATMADGSGAAASVNAYAGGLGLVGLGAAVADAAISNTVTSNVDGVLTGDGSSGSQLTVQAADSSTVSSTAIGAAAGAAAAGVVQAYGTKSSTVSAEILPVSIGSLDKNGVPQGTYNTIIVTASDAGSVSTLAMGAAGGLASGAGADSQATDTAQVTAEAGGVITLGAGGLAVAASDTPNVKADAIGVSVGALSVGVSKATATAAPTVKAKIADGTIFQGASGSIAPGVLVFATADYNKGGYAASANAIAGSGGALVGVAATTATAQDNAAVSALIGNNVSLPNRDVLISAVNNSNQLANSTGVAAGFVAFGADSSSASANGSTTAQLGSGTITDPGSLITNDPGRKFSGALSITAMGSDTNNANAIAGSGGVIAGNASSANTSDTATTTAQILPTVQTLPTLQNLVPPPVFATINGSAFNLQAAHTDNYAASASSINAAEVGASGANTSNYGSATTLALIGDNVILNSGGTITGTAYNSFNNLGGGATGAGGGVLNGAAASGSTNLNGTASVTLGDNVQLNSGTDPVLNTGGITLASYTSLTGSDQSSLNTGGAIAGAGVSDTLTATLNNFVSTGANDTLYSFGNVDVGNWAIVNASTSALVNTWGLAAVGSANASSDVTVNQSVTVGLNSTITGLGNVNLTAGADPLGNWNTSLLASAYAEGYVRGLIAIPLADASNNLTSNAALNISNGAQIISGQNTTIGAYQGTLTPQVDATGHGFELGFIPVTDGSSSANTPTTATLTDNGTVTAGAYHTLTITIPDCQNSGIYCQPGTDNPGTPNTGVLNTSYQTSGMPVSYTFNSAFDPQAYLGLHYAGTIHSGMGPQLLSNTGIAFSTQVSQTPVAALTLGGMTASGGTVTVNADKIIGSGTITSNGGPSITINNYSPDYLILNNISIPNLPGAQIIYTGAAGAAQAQAAGLTLKTIGAGLAPVIAINQVYPGAVGTSSVSPVPGPALILQTGNIDNLGGLISITNANGSLLQSSTNNAQQVVINVPNGAYVLAPTNGVAYLGESPAAQWYDSMNWPGGNPADSATTYNPPAPTATSSANLAIEYVANAMFNANGQYTNATDFSKALIGIDPSNNNPATITPLAKAFYTYAGVGSILFFADSTCKASGCGGDNNWGYSNSLSPINQSVAFNPTHANTFNFPTVDIVPLTKTLTTYPAAANVSNINAAQIIVNAQYIDISGQLNAGVPTNVSLDLPASLMTPVVVSQVFTGSDFFGKPIYTNQITQGGALAIDLYNVTNNLTTQTLFPIYKDNATQSLFTTLTAANTSGTYSTVAQYKITRDQNNAITSQIVLNNVNASSAGASIILNGGILSTTTLGNIHVNTGLGDVNVNNQTGIPLVVGSVNVGQASLAKSLTSSVEITDTLQSLAGNVDNHWLYKYTPSGALTVYNGTAATAASALPQVSNTPGGSTATYTPVQGLVWQWTDSATLHRAYTLDSIGQMSTLANWVWDMPAGSPNNPWTASTGAALQTTSTGTTPPVFTETVSGGVTSSINYNVAYHGCGGSMGSGCNYNFTQNGTESDGTGRAVWSYIYPTAAWLQLTNSVKADNPIAINFSGNATGLLNIASNAPVTLAGQITNPNGSTTISSVGTIRSISGGLLSSGDLSLNTNSAMAGIGQIGLPLIATLSAGAVVNAQGGSDGVYLKFNSGALIGQVAAGTLQTGFGDVAISTAGDMLAAGNNLISGNNITLASPLGAIGRVGTAIMGESPMMLAAGGVVNISALNDISLMQTSGDLKVGSIASIAGTISANVINGDLLNAAGQTSAQTLSDAQVKQIWQTLHLTTANGAPQSIVDTTITPLYLQYWRLMNNGTVANGVFTLNSPTVAIYTPLAAAALGIAAPTTAQVQSYANGLYQNVTTALTNIFDSSTTIVNGAPVTTKVNIALSSLVDFQTYNKDFGSQFAANYAGQLQTMADQAVWTDAQLTSAINRAALTPAAGTVGSATPDISGRNLLLTANNIGQLAAPVNISLADLKSGSLNPDQQKALAAAFAPGDVLPVDANGNVVALDSSSLAGFHLAQAAPLFVGAAGDLTANSRGAAYIQSTQPNLTIASLKAAGNVILAAPQSILSAGTSATQITTTGDLTLSAGSGNLGTALDPLTFQLNGGTLNAASAGQNAWLQAASGDMTIGRVFALDTASLKAPGSILSSLPGVAIKANDILLNADGNIGSATSYLSLQDGKSGSLTGFAGGSAWLYDASMPLQGVSFTAFNDLTVSALYDLTALSLVATNGNVVAASDGNANLTGITASKGSVTLTSAGTLTVGSESAMGDISNIATGNLLADSVSSTTGAVLLNSTAGTLGVNTLSSGLGATLASSGDLTGGTLNVNGGDAAITSANGKVTLASLTDTGNTTVNAKGDLAINQLLSATGDISLAAGGAFTEEANASIRSINGKVTATTGSLLMGAGTGITAAGKINLATTAGDMALGALNSTLGSGQAVNLASAGAIVGNGDGQTNITAAGAQASLTANSDIGSVRLALLTNVPVIDAVSTTGGIWLHNLSDLTSNTILASGAVGLTVDGNLQFATVQGGGDVALNSAGDQTGTTLTSTGGAISDTSGAALTVTTVNGNGNVAMTSAGNLLADSVSSTQGSVLLNSTAGTLGVNTLSSGLGATLASSGDLTGGTLNVNGGDAAITSANGKVTLASLTDTGNTTVNAKGDLAINQLVASGKANLTTGGNLQFATVQGGGDVALNSAGDQTGTTLTSTGGAISDTSGAALTVTTVNGNGNVAMTSAGNLLADSVNSTTGAVLLDSSGGGLSVKAIASALGASLSARDTLQIDSIQVSTKLDLAAANVLVNAKQVPGSGQPLQLNLTGYQGGVANNIEMHIAPISGVVINQLHSDNATLSTDVGNVSIVNGYMPGTLSLTTPFVSLYQNNRSPSLLPVDIQLYQPSAQFKFDLSGKNLITDSYVLNYGFGSKVNVTNYDFGHALAKFNVNGVSAVIDAGTDQSMFTWWLAQPAALMFKSQDEMSNTFMSVSPDGGVNVDQKAPASTLSDLLQPNNSYSRPILPVKERS